MPPTALPTQRPAPAWQRLLLLSLVLLAFARVLTQLDGVNLWWDESLSLQRAESPWSDLLVGRIFISDGFVSAGDNRIATLDQHPFAYFALLRGFIATAGISEFALRLPAAMAATLLVPALWSLARLFERRQVAFAGTALAAALLAALSPFHLWYGQEVRMYAQVAVLAPLALYWLLRWTESAGRARLRAALWALLFTGWLLLTHYFAVYLLPVYIGIAALHVFRTNRTRGLILAGLLSAGALAGGLLIAWWILSQPGAGANFTGVELETLVKDLLNSFSFGPSVAIDQVWWFDVLFGLTALAGIVAAVRNRAALRADGWVLGAFLLAPPLALWVVNRFLPSYMTSRHMAIISGAFLLAVAAGISWLGSRQRWAGPLLGLLLAGCMIYANVSYYTRTDNRLTDYPGMGATLRDHLQPGDLVLLHPPEFSRLFAYYLPDELSAVQPRDGDLVWQMLPLLTGDPAATTERLAARHADARRIWFARVSPLITDDLDGVADTWLAENAFLVKEMGFESAGSIARMLLYLPEPTVFEPGEVAPPQPVDADFGDSIRLRGLEIGAPLVDGRALPIDLYWEPLVPIERRYKYILPVGASRPRWRVADPCADRARAVRGRDRHRFLAGSRQDDS